MFGQFIYFTSARAPVGPLAGVEPGVAAAGEVAPDSAIAAFSPGECVSA
jgi:hypothetical protein